MRAGIKHLSISSQGQVLKSSKGKIDEEIPVPSFLEDTSYHVKIFSKHIFFIVNDGKSQKCGCTKSYSIILNKYWGYTIKKNISFLPELQQASKVRLEHMFKNYDKCSAEWCCRTIT